MVGSSRDVPLVGRERELAVLRAAVAAAAGGDARGVLVGAEAGGGKSRLVRALLEDGAGTAGVVLRAQCVDLGEPGLPLLAMTDLVRAVRAVSTDDDRVAEILAGLSLLAGPAASAAAVAGPLDASRRLQLFDAVTTLLVRVATDRGPVVVVVEDLQWVDDSSADYLRFLLSRVTSERLAVLATVRTDGLAARPRVRRLLSELGRLPSVERLDLAPFDAEEVATYLARLTGGEVDPEAAAAVLRRTRGNPYYVQTLAAAQDEALPRGLADLLVGRVDSLPEDARTVARCAAVVGHAVPDRLLREVAGLGDSAVDAALRQAVAEGVLRPEGAGYGFVHDLLREAVYGDLLPGDRARLHAVHAAALESGTAGRAPAAEVAHHFVQAQDGPKALEWSVRAAEDAMRAPAPGEALHHLERALAEWPGVSDAAARTGLSEGRLAVRAASAAGLAGERARSLEWAGRAIGLCDADRDAAGGVEARAELVRQLVGADAADQVVRPAEDAVRLAVAAGLDLGAQAQARALLARALVIARRAEDARPAVEQALADARAAGAAGTEVEALTTAAFVDELGGDRAAAAERLGAALKLARNAGEPAAELRAHYALASLHYYGGDVGAALPVLRAAMARVADSGLRWSDPGVELRVLHAIALYVSGDLLGSLRATEAPETRPPDGVAARLAAVGCYGAVAAGLPDVEARLAGLRDLWDADPQVALIASGCEADHRAWTGDPAGAVAVVEQAQLHLDTVVGEGMYGGLWLSAVALGALADQASYARERRDDAAATAAVRQGEALLARVERIAEGGHGRPGGLGPEGRAWHQRARAEHVRLGGGPSVAEWQGALAAFGYGHAYEEARCHWRLAGALVAAGDRAAARTHARAAADNAAQIQAAPLQRAVAALVARARLAGASPAEAVLTGREREVLALVAEGLSNREIGKRLYISEKTASVHLSNLMAKLNVSSRTEAVTVAQRRGLLEVF